MLKAEDINFLDQPVLLAERSDRVQVYQVGTAKQDGSAVVRVDGTDAYTPLDSFLKFTPPDSFEWKGKPQQKAPAK